MENQYFFNSPSKSRKILYASILIGTALLAFYFLAPNSTPSILSEYELQLTEFNLYLSQHSKQYSSEEYKSRFQIYRDNLAYIRIHNSQNKNWIMGVSQFSDMTNEEFRSTLLTKVPSNFSGKNIVIHNLNIPTSVDWREKGVVTTPKNQGGCGSCYAFSAGATIESALAIKGKALVELSQQQIVDCSSAYGNVGCNGGWMDNVFEYAMNHKIASEKDYPYLGMHGYCNFYKITGGTTIKGYVDVEPYNYNQLLAAVSINPVSIAVDANSWQHYWSGIIDSNCGIELNHGVVAVGYNLNSNPPYWIVKNSWGEYWGEKGFLKVGISGGYGLCGVNMVPSYPVV